MICVYGKATGRFEWCSIRRTNGMVALTATLSDPWWFKKKWVFWKTPKSEGPFSTFLWIPFKGTRMTFG